MNISSIPFSLIKIIPKIITDSSDLIKQYSEFSSEQKTIISWLVISILAFLAFILFRFIFQILNIQAFDIKLNHKNEQSKLRVSKSILILIFITFYFLLLQTMFAIALKDIPQFSDLIMFVILFLIISEFLIVINIIIFETRRFILKKWYNDKLKNSKLNQSVKLANKNRFSKLSYLNITLKSKRFALIALVLLTILISSISTHSIIFGSNVGDIKEIFSVLIITLILAAVLIALISAKNKKVDFIFLGTDKEKPNIKLFLDYKLNESTTILHNENQTLYVVKREVSDSIIYESFQLSRDGD